MEFGDHSLTRISEKPSINWLTNTLNRNFEIAIRHFERYAAVNRRRQSVDSMAEAYLRMGKLEKPWRYKGQKIRPISLILRWAGLCLCAQGELCETERWIEEFWLAAFSQMAFLAGRRYLLGRLDKSCPISGASRRDFGPSCNDGGLITGFLAIGRIRCGPERSGYADFYLASPNEQTANRQISASLGCRPQ
jgi:hypothetical protein